MFSLHPQLEKDGLFICDLPLCRALLMNNRHFPWVILVPRREAIREIFELTADDQRQLMHESACVAQAMQLHFNADKMNVATLGNMVPQLHMHVIARFRNDARWPSPVWSNDMPNGAYSDADAAHFTKLLTAAFTNITNL